MFRSTPGGVPSWLKILIEERWQGNTPNILTPDEVRRLLAHLAGTSWLAAALIYGTGIRLLECVRLRVRGIDLQHNRLTVRDGADEVNRRLPLPENIQTRLQDHLEDLLTRTLISRRSELRTRSAQQFRAADDQARPVGAADRTHPRHAGIQGR